MTTHQIEYWTFLKTNGRPTYKVYTEDINIRNEIKAITKNKPSAIYSDNKRTIGWDFVVPAEKVDYLKQKFEAKYLKN